MDRKGFIGGSDANRIMAGDWQDLWLEKTGRKDPDDLSNILPVQLGIFTEEFNINWFEKQTGNAVGARQSTFEETIRDVPFKGTIDGIVGDNDLFEAKHTNAFTNMEEQLARYMPQIQLYLRLSRRRGCHVSVIFGNSKWESVYVRYDEPYTAAMLDMVSDFWKHVTTDTPPESVPDTSVSMNGIPINDMVKRDASTDNQFISLANDYLDNEEAAKSFERAKKDLKAMVADNEREVYSPILTISRNARGALLFKKPK